MKFKRFLVEQRIISESLFDNFDSGRFVAWNDMNNVDKENEYFTIVDNIAVSEKTGKKYTEAEIKKLFKHFRWRPTWPQISDIAQKQPTGLNSENRFQEGDLINLYAYRNDDEFCYTGTVFYKNNIQYVKISKIVNLETDTEIKDSKKKKIFNLDELIEQGNVEIEKA